MRDNLKEMAEREATRASRLARKAQEHGCKLETVHAIREEARWLHTHGVSYPERLLEWDFEYKFHYLFIS